MLTRALRMAFWVTYDHPGKLMLANLLWAVALLIPGLAGLAALMTGDVSAMLLVGLPALLLMVVVIVPVFGAGMTHLARELIDTGDGAFSDLFRGMRLYGLRAIVIGAAYMLAVTVLLVSAWFYAARLGATVPLLGYPVSALAVWCLAFVALTQMLVLPALVQKKAGVAATLKLSALLVLDNPLFCLGLAVYFAVLAAVSILLPPAAMFLSGAAAMVLSSTAYEILARKYAAVDREKNGNTDQPDGRAGHVVRRHGKWVFDDSRDDYLNRGFRDFWTPWKS